MWLRKLAQGNIIETYDDLAVPLSNLGVVIGFCGTDGLLAGLHAIVSSCTFIPRYVGWYTCWAICSSSEVGSGDADCPLSVYFPCCRPVKIRTAIAMIVCVGIIDVGTC